MSGLQLPQIKEFKVFLCKMYLEMAVVFFHCLSVAIGGGLTDSQMLRNVICGHILQNWRTLASGVSLFHDNITTQQLYSHKMMSKRMGNFC